MANTETDPAKGTQAPRPDLADAGTATLAWLLALAKKRWGLVAVMLIAATGITLFRTASETKIYRATTTVQIDPMPTRPLGRQANDVVEIGSGSYWSNQEYYRTQYELVRSEPVALAVVRQLGLSRDQGFLKNLAPGAVPPPGAQEVTPETAADVLTGRLTAEPVKDSRLLRIHYEDADPERARMVLSAVTDSYVQRNVDVTLGAVEAAGDWLQTQSDRLKKDLESSEQKLHEYRKEHRILSVSLDDQSNMLREEMAELNRALSSGRARLEALRGRTAELNRIDENEPATIPADEFLKNGALSEFRSRYVNALEEYKALQGQGKGAAHPEVLAAAARVDQLKAATLDELRASKSAAEAELRAVRAEVIGLEELFEKAKQRALDLNLLEIEYRRLERDKTNNTKMFSVVQEKAAETTVGGGGRFNNIHITERARTNPRPVRPRSMLNLIFGVMIGLALGVGGALVAEAADRRIRSPRDAENTLKVVLLGGLPSVHAGDAASEKRRRRASSRRGVEAGPAGALELSAHRDPRGNLAEAARAIRTNLSFMSPDKPYRKLLVTSSEPGEGKTMVAVTIAISLAQTGKRVLLIDTDLRRSRVHRVFGFENTGGVGAAVIENQPLTDLVLPTPVENLFLLPAGGHVPNPAELLQSAKFAGLVADIERSFDIAVFDSPPVQAVTDACILGHQVDATVFVVRAMKSSRDVARRALKALLDINVNVAGCVVNGVDKKSGDYYYYYYHRYYGTPQ